MYRLEKITKIYKDKTYDIQVLSDIDFDIKQGNMIAITGKSGSGKSTLLHIMGLLDEPTSGNIYYKDDIISCKDKNIESFRNKHIGFVFQFHYLLADFTAVENIALPLLISGTSLNKAKRRAVELLTDLNMADRANHYPNQLSGGEQQRVSIARAIINNPDIILADEPTGNLDKTHADDIIEIFKSLNNVNGQTIVIVTHDTSIATQMKEHNHLDEVSHKLVKIKS